MHATPFDFWCAYSTGLVSLLWSSTITVFCCVSVRLNWTLISHSLVSLTIMDYIWSITSASEPCCVHIFNRRLFSCLAGPEPNTQNERCWLLYDSLNLHVRYYLRVRKALKGPLCRRAGPGWGLLLIPTGSILAHAWQASDSQIPLAQPVLGVCIKH